MKIFLRLDDTQFDEIVFGIMTEPDFCIDLHKPDAMAVFTIRIKSGFFFNDIQDQSAFGRIGLPDVLRDVFFPMLVRICWVCPDQ